MDWILTRLTEPSTWRGIISLATSFGIVLRPELQSAIIAAGLSLIGLVNIIRKESKP